MSKPDEKITMHALFERMIDYCSRDVELTNDEHVRFNIEIKSMMDAIGVDHKHPVIPIREYLDEMGWPRYDHKTANEALVYSSYRMPEGGGLVLTYKSHDGNLVGLTMCPEFALMGFMMEKTHEALMEELDGRERWKRGKRR